MQGLGNDFVVVEEPDLDRDTVTALTDRRRGVGADGVLAMTSHLVMQYWNADGTNAEMCGNGLRCLARRAVDRGWAEPGEWFRIETPVGPRKVLVADEVTVELGRVEIVGHEELHGHRFTTATIGNPHAVSVVDDPDEVDVAELGHRVGTHPSFPNGTNVEFVSVAGAGRLRLRVWERGVGETPACGSGIVVAAAVAAGTAGTSTVEVRGGTAEVRFEDGSGYLTGPAVTVFEGEWPDR